MLIRPERRAVGTHVERKAEAGELDQRHLRLLSLRCAGRAPQQYVREIVEAFERRREGGERGARRRERRADEQPPLRRHRLAVAVEGDAPHRRAAAGRRRHLETLGLYITARLAVEGAVLAPPQHILLQKGVGQHAARQPRRHKRVAVVAARAHDDQRRRRRRRPGDGARRPVRPRRDGDVGVGGQRERGAAGGRVGERAVPAAAVLDELIHVRRRRLASQRHLERCLGLVRTLDRAAEQRVPSATLEQLRLPRRRQRRRLPAQLIPDLEGPRRVAAALRLTERLHRRVGAPNLDVGRPTRAPPPVLAALDLGAQYRASPSPKTATKSGWRAAADSSRLIWF